MMAPIEQKPMTIKVPKVGDYNRCHGKLVEIEDVTPEEPLLDYIFENTEATLVGRCDDVTVVTFSTFNNLSGNGPNACVSSAIAEANRLRIKLKSLEFVVIKTTTQVRMRPSPNGHENLYAKGTIDMLALDWGRSKGLPDDIIKEVWSSIRGWLDREVEADARQ